MPARRTTMLSDLKVLDGVASAALAVAPCVELRAHSGCRLVPR